MQATRYYRRTLRDNSWLVDYLEPIQEIIDNYNLKTGKPSAAVYIGIINDRLQLLTSHDAFDDARVHT